jgi:solute carrier family 25 S-adenosylmethionine transporter 26
LLPTPVIHAAASSLAELVSCAILTPAEVIKQNAQMVSSSDSSTNATIQTLRKFQSNPLALWRGYASLAGRNLPFTAMQFPMFERLKQRIKEYRDEKGLTRGTIVESGIITSKSGKSGANGKNGLVDALGESVKKSRRGQKGTWQITQEIVKEQGYKGLWRGGALRAVWTFVGAGLYLGAYESGRVYLAARRGEHVDDADLM